MSRLVVGASSAELAVTATEQAIKLLGGDHRIIVLCVTDPALISSPIADNAPSSTARIVEDDTVPEVVLASAQRVEADAHDELDEALRLRHLDSKVRVRVDTGELGETLCRVALEEHADLIVLGRRRTARARRLRRVIDTAHCPVLVVTERA